MFQRLGVVRDVLEDRPQVVQSNGDTCAVAQFLVCLLVFPVIGYGFGIFSQHVVDDAEGILSIPGRCFPAHAVCQVQALLRIAGRLRRVAVFQFPGETVQRLHPRRIACGCFQRLLEGIDNGFVLGIPGNRNDQEKEEEV
jgi:hypothetical protein